MLGMLCGRRNAATSIAKLVMSGPNLLHEFSLFSFASWRTSNRSTIGMPFATDIMVALDFAAQQVQLSIKRRKSARHGHSRSMARF